MRASGTIAATSLIALGCSGDPDIAVAPETVSLGALNSLRVAFDEAVFAGPLSEGEPAPTFVSLDVTGSLASPFLWPEPGSTGRRFSNVEVLTDRILLLQFTPPERWGSGPFSLVIRIGERRASHSLPLSDRLPISLDRRAFCCPMSEPWPPCEAMLMGGSSATDDPRGCSPRVADAAPPFEDFIDEHGCPSRRAPHGCFGP